MTTIPKNSRRVTQLKTELTDCQVFSLGYNFQAQPCDPARAWDMLRDQPRTRLTTTSDGVYVISVHSNLWYELRRAPKPAPAPGEHVAALREHPDQLEDHLALFLRGHTDLIGHLQEGHGLEVTEFPMNRSTARNRHYAEHERMAAGQDVIRNLKVTLAAAEAELDTLTEQAKAAYQAYRIADQRQTGKAEQIKELKRQIRNAGEGK